MKEIVLTLPAPDRSSRIVSGFGNLPPQKDDARSIASSMDDESVIGPDDKRMTITHIRSNSRTEIVVRERHYQLRTTSRTRIPSAAEF